MDARRQASEATDPTPADRSGFAGAWQLIREDCATNDRQLTSPGFQALAAVRIGNLIGGIDQPLLRKPVSLVYKVLARLVRVRHGIEVHATMRMGRRVKITHQGTIIFDKYCVIGDECLIRQSVTIGGDGWKVGRDSSPVVGARVRFAAGSTVMGNVVVGDDTVIGPNAVVMSDVPAKSMVIAPPSRTMPRSEGGPG